MGSILESYEKAKKEATEAYMTFYPKWAKYFVLVLVPPEFRFSKFFFMAGYETRLKEERR